MGTMFIGPDGDVVVFIAGLGRWWYPDLDRAVASHGTLPVAIGGPNDPAEF